MKKQNPLSKATQKQSNSELKQLKRRIRSKKQTKNWFKWLQAIYLLCEIIKSVIFLTTGLCMG